MAVLGSLLGLGQGKAGWRGIIGWFGSSPQKAAWFGGLDIVVVVIVIVVLVMVMGAWIEIDCDAGLWAVVVVVVVVLTVASSWGVHVFAKTTLLCSAPLTTHHSCCLALNPSRITKHNLHEPIYTYAYQARLGSSKSPSSGPGHNRVPKSSSNRSTVARMHASRYLLPHLQ
jgi:hypothetical protein